MTPEIFPKCLHHNCNDLIRINTVNIPWSLKAKSCKICTKSRDGYSHEWGSTTRHWTPAPPQFLNIEQRMDHHWHCMVHHDPPLQRYEAIYWPQWEKHSLGPCTPWHPATLGKVESPKKSGFFAFEKSKLQHGRKHALNLGKCQALSNVELNHQKKKHEFDSTNLRSNLIYVVYFKSFPDARWFSPNHRGFAAKTLQHFQQKTLAIATKMQYDLGLLRSNSQFHSHPRKLKLFFWGGRARQNIATLVEFLWKKQIYDIS